MKHRVREAIFNLISTDSRGKHAIDLFAGSGALGLEAISRGAQGATLIEQHVPTAKLIAANVSALDLEEQVELLVTSAFLWARRDLENNSSATRVGGAPLDVPWLVFCSPPYRFYIERCDEMLRLLRTIANRAPRGSVIVAEADDRFDFQQLAEAGAQWDVRTYPPAVVAVRRETGEVAGAAGRSEPPV